MKETTYDEKAMLSAELVGTEHLLSITPEDRLVTPLLKERITEIKEELRKLERPDLGIEK